MKDNRMRQSKNKWNNRGPRQVVVHFMENPAFLLLYPHLYPGSDPNKES